MFRAVHQILDGTPKVFDDPLATRILGPETTATIRDEAERHGSAYLVRARTVAVMRSRFVEDELKAAINRGVRQYVILGAGLDTSPYRYAALAERLTVYEVDHPDTQRWKLKCLSDAQIEIPPNVRHVPVNFEVQSLGESLRTAGFDQDRVAFFSWLGVTYYLGRRAFGDTLKYIAAGAPGTQVVFDFGVNDEELNTQEREAFAAFSEFLEQNNEPWLSRFSPRELKREVHKLGFSDSFHLSRDLATERYLKNRDDGLCLDVLIQMMSATV